MVSGLREIRFALLETRYERLECFDIAWNCHVMVPDEISPHRSFRWLCHDLVDWCCRTVY
jgi:hypothetical protein